MSQKYSYPFVICGDQLLILKHTDTQFGLPRKVGNSAYSWYLPWDDLYPSGNWPVRSYLIDQLMTSPITMISGRRLTQPDTVIRCYPLVMVETLLPPSLSILGCPVGINSLPEMVSSTLTVGCQISSAFCAHSQLLCHRQTLLDPFTVIHHPRRTVLRAL